MNEVSTVSLVGLGNMGIGYDSFGGKLLGTAKSHLGALLAMPNLEIVYGVDIKMDSAFLNSHTLSYELLLYDKFSSSELNYDLLVLATPTSTHLNIVDSLIRKHYFRSIILEKPCGSNLAECKKILDLLEAKSISWQVNYFRSALPNTQQALQKIHDMKICPSKAIITGYGDLLNIFSHFLHLMMLFVDLDCLVVDEFDFNSDQIGIRFESGFEVELHNIGGAKKDLPILSLIFDSYHLVFSGNGQTIELVHSETKTVVDTFILQTLDRYQELATKEYLGMFARRLSGNRRSVEKVHEIISAVNFQSV